MAGSSVQMDPAVNDVLRRAYEHYVKTMVDRMGRPLADPDKADIDRDGNRTEKVTFSEAISYQLMRSAIMNDQTIFDRVWLWASANMQRKNIASVFNPETKTWANMSSSKKDNLFAWRYTPTADGKKGGVLSTYDFDPASDADQDIAAALLMADKKWGSKGKIDYKAEALAILNDIWNGETAVIGGKRILKAGDTQNYANDPIRNVPATGINVSYLRPSYYDQLFAEADPGHDWKSMVAPSYEVIRMAERALMHNEAGQPVQGKVNLVPDWVTMDAKGVLGDHSWVPNDYFHGADAFRTNFWIALQFKLYPNDASAREYCDCSKGGAKFSPCLFLQDQMKKNGTIFSGYNIDGTVHWPNEELYTLGADLAFFTMGADNENMKKLYEKIGKLYNADGYWGSDPENYYGQNWIWLGLYLMNGGTMGMKSLVGQTGGAVSSEQIGSAASSEQVGSAVSSEQVAVKSGSKNLDAFPTIAESAFNGAYGHYTEGMLQLKGTSMDAGYTMFFASPLSGKLCVKPISGSVDILFIKGTEPSRWQQDQIMSKSTVSVSTGYAEIDIPEGTNKINFNTTGVKARISVKQ